MDIASDLVNVWLDDEDMVDWGRKLAGDLQIQMFDRRPKSELALFLKDGKIGLGFTDERPFRPYYVDYLSLKWRYRKARGLKRNKLFLTALGIKEGVSVIDATAGFGQDAFLMAWAGANVVAVEKSKIVFTLLENGLKRAQLDDFWEGVVPRIEVVYSDSREFVRAHPNEFDVIYIDPMFNKPKRSAKSQKSMQILQKLIVNDRNENEELVNFALESARSRVVIKLPLKGVSAFGKPNITFAGQSIRYDVYMKSPR